MIIQIGELLNKEIEINIWRKRGQPFTTFVVLRITLWNILLHNKCVVTTGLFSFFCVLMCYWLIHCIHCSLDTPPWKNLYCPLYGVMCDYLLSKGTWMLNEFIEFLLLDLLFVFLSMLNILPGDRHKSCLAGNINTELKILRICMIMQPTCL